MTAAFARIYAITFAIAITSCHITLAEEGDPAELTVNAEDTAKAEKLIERLSDTSFDTRKAARAELSEMGWKALPALEVSYQKRPNKFERDLSFEALIAAAKRSRFDSAYPIFLADKDRKFKHDFHAWNELSQACGDTEGSRRMMIDILDREEQLVLLRECCSMSKQSLQAISDRWLYILTGRHKAKPYKGKPRSMLEASVNAPDEIATLLLCELLVPGEAPIPESVNDPGSSHPVSPPYGVGIRNHFVHVIRTSYLCIPEFEGDGNYGDALLQLCARWVKTRNTFFGLGDARYLAKYMRHYELDIFYQTLVRCLESKEYRAEYKTGPMSELLRLQDQKSESVYRSMLDDTTPMTGFNMKDDLQIRDCALLAILLLRDLDPANYGFSYQIGKKTLAMYPRGSEEELGFRLHLGNYLFVTDEVGSTQEKRSRAFAKFHLLENVRMAVLYFRTVMR